MNKTIYYNNLYSIYKELLTAKESEIFSLYYEENLSMGEIATNKNITRSAVGNTIKIVENKLTDFENKLHIDKRNQMLEKLKKNTANNEDLSQKIAQILSIV